MHQGGTVSVCAHKWGLINSHKASQHLLTLWSRAVIPPPMIPLPYSNSSSHSTAGFNRPGSRMGQTRCARDTLKIPHSSTRWVILRKPAASTSWSISAWLRRRITQAWP